MSEQQKLCRRGVRGRTGDRGHRRSWVESITIQDNAGGIDTETIRSILDYSIRVSSREAYVSPTRGAQGNAMKCLLAMGYVLDRKTDSVAAAAGVTIIETRGIRHQTLAATNGHS
jgi:hypothetical protein